MFTVLRRSVRRSVAALSAATLAGVLFSAGVADAAAPVSCGATLKYNSTLTKNLSCPAGNGLTLGKNVVLNLNNFTLSGPGSGTALTFSPLGGSGVANGTISNWGTGLDDYHDDIPTLPSKISKVNFSKAPLSFTLSVVAIGGSSFTSSPITDFQSKFTISTSKFTKSQVSGFYSNIAITSSTITGGGVDDGAAQEVTIDKSTMDGTGYAGSPASCSETGVTITNSTVKNYKQPISGYYCGVTLTNNTFTNNPGGVLADVSSGFVEGEAYTFITNNTFKTSGIVLSTGAMVVTGNTFSGNTTGLIATEPQYTTVTGNTFSANTSSGVRAIGTGLILKNNKAINNGRYGINAPGAVNKGGNVAYGNPMGDCIGLVCAKK